MIFGNDQHRHSANNQDEEFETCHDTTIGAYSLAPEQVQGYITHTLMTMLISDAVKLTIRVSTVGGCDFRSDVRSDLH